MTPFHLDRPDVILPASAPLRVWEAERLNGIGGSDVASAAGIGFDSPYTLWAVKTGRISPTFTEAEQDRLRSGHLHEPTIRNEFRRRHPEFVVTRPPGTLAVPGAHWQRVNVDGLVWSLTGDLLGVFEAKAHDHHQAAKYEGDATPIPYVCQVQWAMHVTGAERSWLFAMIDTHTFVEREIPRDDELIGDLLDLAARLWQQVQDDTEPPVDAAGDTKRTLAMIRERQGSRIVLPAAWEKHVVRRAELSAEIDSLMAERDLLDNQMRAAMGDNVEAHIDGLGKVATHKAPRDKISITKENLSRLEVQHPDIYAEYVTTKPVGRRLSYGKIHPGTTVDKESDHE